LPAIALPSLHISNIQYKLLNKAEELVGKKITGGSNEAVWLSKYIEKRITLPHFNHKHKLNISNNDSSKDILFKFINYYEITHNWKKSLITLSKENILLEWASKLIRNFSKSKYNTNTKLVIYKIPTNKVIKQGIPYSLSIRSPAVVAIPYINKNLLERIKKEDIPKSIIIKEKICEKDRTKLTKVNDNDSFKTKRMNENLTKLKMILDRQIKIPNTTTIQQVKKYFFPLPEIKNISLTSPFNTLLNNKHNRKQLEDFLIECNIPSN